MTTKKPNALLLKAAADCGIQNADRMTAEQIGEAHSMNIHDEYEDQFDLSLKEQLEIHGVSIDY